MYLSCKTNLCFCSCSCWALYNSTPLCRLQWSHWNEWEGLKVALVVRDTASTEEWKVWFFNIHFCKVWVPPPSLFCLWYSLLPSNPLHPFLFPPSLDRMKFSAATVMSGHPLGDYFNCFNCTLLAYAPMSSHTICLCLQRVTDILKFVFDI